MQPDSLESPRNSQTFIESFLGRTTDHHQDTKTPRHQDTKTPRHQGTKAPRAEGIKPHFLLGVEVFLANLDPALAHFGQQSGGGGLGVGGLEEGIARHQGIGPGADQLLGVLEAHAAVHFDEEG